MKPGTTLIECIVYMAGCTFCTFIIITWWSTASSHIHRLEDDLSTQIQLHMIEQIMTRDFSQAGPRAIDWTITPDQLALPTSEGDLFYKCKKGIITRSIRKQGAARRAKAVIARGIESIEWSAVIENDQVKSVLISVAARRSKISFICPVKRGMV